MTEYDAGPDAPATGSAGGVPLGRTVQWMGGLASLALIAGLGVWGYRLIIRDVEGVPVVRALEGPARVTPENPGGVLAEHQGLAVNAVPGDGSAEDLADRLMLAPEVMTLADEDVAEAELLPEEEPAATPASTEAEDKTAPALDIAEYSQFAELSEEGAPEEPSKPQSMADAVKAAVAEARAAEEAGELPQDDVAKRDARGIARSPMPRRRPAGFSGFTGGPEKITRVAASPAVDAPEELSPEEVPTGTRLVQLGAFESADVARQQWQRIGGRFEDYFAGKRRVVQRAESGGRIFYRLRAEGFSDLADARRFCAVLTAEGADCIPVLVR